MQAEVRAVNEAAGWWDEDVLFKEALANLHSEVSEAGDAWRRWGLADATHYDVSAGGPVPKINPLAKPEGVGSEFADILIRSLDNDERYGIGLASLLPEFSGAFGVDDSFLVNMDMLHNFIASASMMWESDVTGFSQVGWADWLVRALAFTFQLAEHYGIDMMAEYRRKLEYNKTRPYRHGDKRK